MTTESHPLPVKGERYCHPRLRGVWTVQSCGPKLIRLKSNIPHLGFMSAWGRVQT